MYRVTPQLSKYAVLCTGLPTKYVTVRTTEDRTILRLNKVFCPKYSQFHILEKERKKYVYVAENHKCIEIESINSVQSSMTSHLLLVTS